MKSTITFLPENIKVTIPGTEKIKVYRQSGTPVKLDEYKAYQEEYVALADKITEKAGMNMELSHRLYRYMEYCLKKKYPSFLEIDFPHNTDIMKDLITEFGTPVTFAIAQENKELIILLLDEMM